MLSTWFTLSLLSLLYTVNGLEVVPDLISTDCSNSTHRWSSQNGHCFDEEAGAIPYTPSPPLQNPLGRYIGGLGITPRDSGCAVDESACWIVNCCQPGETCGPITVGCIASWSTIYTTTTSTSWSTIVDIVTPTSDVSYTTATASTTAYITSYHPVTLPGAGLDTVVVTVTTTSTSLILSAFTPPPVTLTESAPNAAITNAPDVKRAVLQYANLPRRQARTSYTTLTVYVTTYYTAHSTSTLANNLLTTTKIIGISSTATRNQTHYATPTGFTTITQTMTDVVSSYAFGTLSPQTITTTASLSSSIVAGVTPTDSSGASSQSNPPGADSSKPHKLSPGAIAGLVVGLILLAILLSLCIGFLCCIRRRKRREAEYLEKSTRSRRRGSLDDVPSPPSPPTPQPAMSSHSNTPSPPFLRPNSNSPVSPGTSPVMVGAMPLGGGQRAYHSNNGNGGNGSRLAGRKSSRSSIVSITPVPEEDEGEEEEIVRGPNSRRNSNDSTRSWGRGYGGRGGYYGSRTNLNDSRRTGSGNGNGIGRNDGSNSPTHPAFRGVIRSTYSDESLVPPHAR